MIEKFNIKIIFENDDFLVLDKPAGLMVHGDGRSTDKTLVDFLIQKYPEIENVGEDQILQNGIVLKRPGIVHRLDRDTSGIMVVAKNQEMHRLLKSQFTKHKVQKKYLAFLNGELKKDEGVIDLSIGRSRTNPVLWSASRGKKEPLREAITRFRVLERGGGFSLVEAEPKTGRTHQIRVHFKALNCPIVGDFLYGVKKIADNPERANQVEGSLGFKRLALHSSKITFKDRNGQVISFKAELPADLKKAIDLAGFTALC